MNGPRWWASCLVLTLFVGVLLVPIGVAPCPHEPRDCMTLIFSSEKDTDDSGILAESWLYKDDDDELQMEASMGGFSILQANGTYSVGDSGGVVFRISRGASDPGGFSTALPRITFDGAATGVAWTNGTSRSFTYDFSANDEVFVAFPFTVTGGDSNVELTYDVTTHEGTADESTVSESHSFSVAFPATGGMSASWFGWGLLAIILALLLYGLYVSHKP